MVINFSDLCAVALGCIRASMYRVNRAEDEGLNFWSRPSVSLGAHLTIQVYGDCTTRMLLPSSRTLHCIRACCLPLSPKLSLSLCLSLSLSVTLLLSIYTRCRVSNFQVPHWDVSWTPPRQQSDNRLRLCSRCFGVEG